MLIWLLHARQVFFAPPSPDEGDGELIDAREAQGVALDAQPPAEEEPDQAPDAGPGALLWSIRYCFFMLAVGICLEPGQSVNSCPHGHAMVHCCQCAVHFGVSSATLVLVSTLPRLMYQRSAHMINQNCV